MIPIGKMSYEEFNHIRRELGFTMTELHHWPFPDHEKHVTTMLRAVCFIKPKIPNPWWDEFKLLALRDINGNSIIIMVLFDAWDHDKCHILTGLYNEGTINTLLQDIKKR